MPTIMEIADLADVPMEGVMRVLNGDPVGEKIAKRVRLAIATLGPPHEALAPQDIGVVEPSPRPGPGEIMEAPQAGQPTSAETVVSAREDLMERISRATADLGARLPEGVGSVVYEAVRVEVEPVARHMDQMGALVERLGRAVERIDDNVTSERQARFEDIKLLTDLIVTGWQTVDRRLARVESMLENAESDRRRRWTVVAKSTGRRLTVSRARAAEPEQRRSDERTAEGEAAEDG